METLTYPYRAQTKQLALGIVFFGGGAVFMAYTAMTNDRGLIIDSLIHLGRENATIFYWVWAGLAGVMAALAVVGMVFGRSPTRRIVFSAGALSVPRPLRSTSMSVVPVADIWELGVRQVRNQRFLLIRHRRGTLWIAASQLPDAAAFDRLYSALKSSF